jgi:hypothetical protein
MKYTKQYYLIVMYLGLLFSCNSKGAEENAKDAAFSKKETTSSDNNTNQALSTNAKASFKVNGVQANTQKTGANDIDEHSGMLNLQNNFLLIDLRGDDPSFLRRNSLTISVYNFKPEPTTYKLSNDAYCSFSRATMANGGNVTQYSSALDDMVKDKDKRKFEVTFTKVEKKEAEFFDEYYVSGNFTATMTLSLGFQNDVSKIEISDGSFENVLVKCYGKPKN